MKAIILGDVLLDINYNCNTVRKAPEADIPVYNTLNEQYILGGAANVAKNMVSFGIETEMISVIGDDWCGLQLKTMLHELGVKTKLYVDSNKKTTQKNRVFDGEKLINRFDIETIENIEDSICEQIIEYIKIQSDIDAIVFSDYAKGFLTKKLCETIIEYSNKNGILTFVDPKTKDAIKYKGCFLFKLNLLEGEIVSGKISKNDIIETIKDLIQCKHLILTCGETGMYVDSLSNHVFHKSKLPVVDVTGCGDTVLSVVTYLYLKTNDVLWSSKIANYVAGKCLGKIGNYHASLNDIDEYIDVVIHDNEMEKILFLGKNTTGKIVFTNGCFDIIHSAHLRLMQFSKKQGDVLVVGLNSDDSIKRFKGASRPINSIDERIELLKSLGFIDYIIVFNDDSPLHILSLLRPNVLVKGGDYTKETVIGAEYANEVIIYDYINGLSTTNVIKKIELAKN
jgi:D-beta-D-heptose 7-phosphate kinase/D-beta-D-heptose 1-phosphate adenosyltransferase